jgi:hypothetical protein
MKRGRGDEQRATPSTGASQRRGPGIRSGPSRNIDLEVHVAKAARRTSGQGSKEERPKPSTSPEREAPERREVHTRHARMKKERKNIEAMETASRKNEVLDEYFELASRMYLGEHDDEMLESLPEDKRRTGEVTIRNMILSPHDANIDNLVRNGQDSAYIGEGKMARVRNITPLELLTSPLRNHQIIDLWGPKEIAIFEAGICRHGKNFYVIAKLIQTKTRAEVVNFYYIWKKTSRYVHWKKHRSKHATGFRATGIFQTGAPEEAEEAANMPPPAAKSKPGICFNFGRILMNFAS